MHLPEIVAHYNDLLRVDEVPDYPGALNGLQVESAGEVRRVAFAVDASQASIDAAVECGADLLVVHHGLFWDGTQPLTGRRYRRVSALLRGNLALYSVHLPLDAHPALGNNFVLARELGIEIQGSFGEYKGVEIGVWGVLEMRREALAARLDEVLGGRVRMIPGGPERIQRVGVITGGAGGQIGEARARGLDAFITGEASHHHYFDAMEGGVTVYLGGHYATEVWGIRALAEHTAQVLGLDTCVIDQPTGL